MRCLFCVVLLKLVCTALFNINLLASCHIAVIMVLFKYWLPPFRVIILATQQPKLLYYYYYPTRDVPVIMAVMVVFSQLDLPHVDVLM